ncbi:MAG: helical backbone metal receptor [bacterium]|nr:helical backbone metal receptor [bacterium]
MYGDRNNYDTLVNPRLPGLIIALTLLLGLTACQSQRLTLTCQPPEVVAASPSANAAQGPSRIVSLVPSLTETVCDLGLAAQLQGITANDDYPPDILGLPKVGDMNPDYEFIVALHPDAVLTDTTITNEHIRSRLKSLGLPVIETHIEYLRDLPHELPHLGEALRCSAQAQTLTNEIQTAIATAKKRADALPRRPRVYIDVYNNPLLTAGKPSLLHELLEIAGGENVYADIDKAYPNISAEDLLIRQPDIMLLTSLSAAEVKKHPQLSKIQAVQQGNILEMPSSLMQRPTKRSLQSIEIMQNYFEEWAKKGSSLQ